MRYNEKYDLYIDDDFMIYYWDKKLDKLMQIQVIKNQDGYLQVKIKQHIIVYIHRLLYETFIGPIPAGYEIDHIDTNPDNNCLENLKLVTHKENCNNPLTKKHYSEAKKGNTYRKEKLISEFGMKFKEHYGITYHQNITLYEKERRWYHRHNNKCRWE